MIIALTNQILIHVAAMVLLLCGSAFFSGSETAFFNLSRREIRCFKESSHRLHRLVARLLKSPGRLLSCVSFGNMVVNVLFFAISSVLVIRFKSRGGLTLAAASVVISFAALVLLGEIVPKSLAYGNSRTLSVFAALPVYFCIRLFAPLDALFKFLILEPVLRLSLGATRKIKALTVEEFRSLIEAGEKQGFITVDENRLMTEVAQLGYLKVRHVMQPRVEMIACPETAPMETAQDLMREHNLTEIPVYVGTIDNIVGIVRRRQILLKPAFSVDKIVQRVHFVPEQKTVESLLQFFRQVKTDLAIVVDEYGGIAGSVRLGDIAEELFGEVESAKVFDLIEQTGPYEYRLAGSLPVRELAYLFGIHREDIRQSTIGGLVTALLGKIPSPGDTAHWKNLRFAVESVQKNRIKTLMVTFNRRDKNGH